MLTAIFLKLCLRKPGAKAANGLPTVRSALPVLPE
jgi:hypothetical protein